MAHRQATWHLRPTEPTEISRFRKFVEQHGFVYESGQYFAPSRRLNYRRGDQTIGADFYGTGFLAAWLHPSENHRGKQISDKALIELFVTEPQEWAIAHFDEWLSIDEGSVVERQLEKERAEMAAWRAGRVKS